MTLRVSIEGSRSIWTYSVDDVRSLIEAYKRANEDAYFSNPAARPQATLKAS
jgi:hypothetical protein